MSKDKEIDNLSDDEFEKLSEEGGITPQPESDEEEQETPKEEDPKEDPKEEEEPEKVEEPQEEEEEKETVDSRYDSKEAPHVPYSKFKKEKEKRETMKAEYEEKIAKMQEDFDKVDKSSKNKNIEDDIKSIAKEHGVDEGLLKKIIDTSKAYSGVDPSLEKRLSEYEAQQQQAQEDILFDKDFNDNVLSEIRKSNEDVTLAKTQEVKDFIKEIAYQDGNEKVPLKYLLAYNQDKINKMLEIPKGKKSAESSRPGSQKNNKDVDYDNVNGDDIKSMSDEEFDKYSEYREKQDGSNLTIYRKGQKLNN